MIKRFFAIVLCALMALSALPSAALSEGEPAAEKGETRSHESYFNDSGSNTYFTFVDSNTPWIELLLQNGCHVTVCDKRSAEQMSEEGKRLAALGASLKLGDTYLDDLDQDIIFRSPGLLPFDEHKMIS